MVFAGATSPGPAGMVVLVWRGCVRAVVLGRAAGLLCCGTVAVVVAGEGGAVAVPPRSGSRVVRRGWEWVPTGVPRLVSGRV